MRLIVSFFFVVVAFATGDVWLRGVAQVPEQRSNVRFTVRDGLRFLNEFTNAYIEHVASKENNGAFVLDETGARILSARILEITKLLSAAEEKQPITARLTPENRQQVLMAVKCEGCWP